MSREYRLPEYLPYAHMLVHPIQQSQPHQFQEQQPQPHHYPTHYPMQHQPQTLSNSGASTAYELTAAASAAAAEVGLSPTASLHPLDPRKRNASHYGEYDMTDPQCSGSEPSLATAASAGASVSARKRKSSSFGTGSSLDDDCDTSRSSSARNSCAASDKKQNHSEIEKRRRDKMNTYISELSGMIPMCGAMARKLDKLSVLRLAVAHLRGVRGALTAGALAARPRPALLPQRDLNALLLHVARAHDAFLFVVGCDGGRLLYASHTVHSTLHYHQTELVGQSLFDILHPKDVAKVKEQLSSSDLSPRERLIDAKTMLPVRSEVVSGAQRLSPGARRSFLCRIKCKQPSDQPTGVQPSPPTPPPPKPASKKDDGGKHRKKHEKKYCVVQCTGYLKSWAPVELESGAGEEEEQASLSCLVAVCRALAEPPAAAAPPPPACPLQYMSRHALDGKFLFVDQRVRLALGFLPQELLGTSLYEYVSGAELGALARAHKHALMHKHALHTAPYPFRRKDGSTATIQTHFKPFRNPWTKDIECLVANNTLLPDDARDEDMPHPSEPFKQTEEWRAYLRGGGQGAGSGAEQAAGEPAGGAPPTTESDSEVARLIASQMESHKIGACIAEEARRRPPSAPPSPPHHLMNDPVFNASLDNILGMDLNAFTVRNNVPLSVAGGAPSPAGPLPPASPPLPLDGNGEAAMAVIMSLLEADAGLGGPVNINGLPWPLP